MSFKEPMLMLKCGLLVGDEQIGDFKCISWFYGPSKPYLRPQSKGSVTSQTLRERLKTIFPEIVQPFQVVYIDEYDDKIILPVDDVKESITALQCFGYLTSLPLKIFIHLPDQKKQKEDLLRHEEHKDVSISCEDSGQKIADTLSKLEKTIHTLGERIVLLLENFDKSSSVDLKPPEKVNESADKSEELLNMAMSQESATIKASATTSDAESLADGHPTHFRPPSSTSSSSFSVQSHSGEDDWTRVGGRMNIGGRRRRFTTESSCTSHQSDNLQDGDVRSMEDEMSSIMFDMLCRNP